MLRIAQTAAALLLLLFLANQVQGWSFQATNNDKDDVSERVKDNSYDGHDEYYEGGSEEDGDGEEEEDYHHDYDDLFYLEDDEVEDRMTMQGKKALRHRTRPRNHREDLHGSRELRSKSNARSYSRSFLDPDIEPRPFINCIPLPPDISRSGSASKGKGKGKGNRRNNRRYNSKSRRKLKSSSSSRGRSRGRVRRSSLSGRSFNGGRMGRGGRGRMKKLPYCPLPTFAPTFLPTITPFPTSTPLPTITPFPSFTPFPSNLGGPSLGPSTAPSKGPTTKPSISSRPSAIPTRSNAPSKSNQPSKSSAPSTSGTTVRTVAWRYSYSFTGTVRQPTTEEYNGLYTATDNFMFDSLRARYPNTLISYQRTGATPTYSANAAQWNSFVDFEAQVTFDNNQDPNSNAALYNVLMSFDHMSYATMYVLSASPTSSIYRNINALAFSASGTDATGQNWP